MKLHTIPGHIQSIYLAEYPDKLLLLDGGCRADIEPLVAYIENELGRSIHDLKAVVVTHMHPDHAGAANMLRQRYGTKIIAGDQPGQWYQGVAGILMHWMDLLLATYVASRKGSRFKNLWYSRHLFPDIKLGDGEVIPEFEDWQVWHTVGHTDRDLTLCHQPTRLLYVADLIVALKHKYVAPFPVFLPHQYRYSLKRVYEYQPQTLLLAHQGEMAFDQEAYEGLLKSSPRFRVTHWWVIRTKGWALVRGFLNRNKNKRQS
ncbi:MBL fold metallo-hydrolase [Vibrio sp. SCSIO 43136]|uniref:MBL fold metallo-hydrolase n=1 Tax=Vibrio sp. SCSIO 43136 TaxID=2819101 RepID=UPI002074D43C|nr:MBL fold metallo-hydrolase [Vibrio sp. SCSIO 43136]USD65478.1 MBL fold metallo-hydrolase [Vibrio sp. SCSIO 43136]